MPTDREIRDTLRETDSCLDKIISTMYEHPSYYEGVISTIREARKFVRDKPAKALELTKTALADCEAEAAVAMEYHRIVDGIAPDDPVFNEDKVKSRMDEYRTDLRKGDVKGAVKAIEHLRKAIGGRGRPPAIQVRLESDRISREDKTARLIISNVDTADVILNSVYVSANVWSEDVLLTVPVIRAGNSADVPITIGSEALESGSEDTYRHSLAMQVLKYIDRHYQKASLTELCRDLNQSPSGLSKLVREQTGKTFSELLLDKRLSRARELIEHSTLPITEIIHLVGYENTSYFYRTFSEKFGQSPREIRTSGSETSEAGGSAAGQYARS